METRFKGDSNEKNNTERKGFDPRGRSRKKNEGSDLSSGQRGWEPMVNALKDLKDLKGISDEQQQEWVKIHVEKGKIEFFDKEGKHETLNKQKNPAEFLQFEYNLRKHLVKEDLSGVLDNITEVEKREGVYEIKCGNQKYEIRKQEDGRYSLFNKQKAVIPQDIGVNDWEKTIRDLKLKVRNIHISEELEESIRILLIGDSKDVIKDIDGTKVKLDQINSGQIVDYDKGKKEWTIRTEGKEGEDGEEMHRFELDREKEIEKHARVRVINELKLLDGKELKVDEVKEVQISDGQCTVVFNKEGEKDRIISLDSKGMEEMEKTSIDNITFTEEENRAVMNLRGENDGEIENKEKELKNLKRRKEVLYWSLQLLGFLDGSVRGVSQNFEAGVGQIMQLQAGQNDGGAQYGNQIIADGIGRGGERKIETREKELEKLRTERAKGLKNDVKG